MTDTTLKLSITDGGTLKPLLAGSQQFKTNMQAGAAALAKGQMPGRAHMPRAAQQPGMAGREELTSYGIARGAVGTGAAGRDFSKQAAGLGGLVHVYATFAANLFAAGAAFRALSNAMDASNLVKGLDQIGAASGKNLGSLARQMAKASDGAISLQQAMSSTAMAAAGGMTNQQIIKMTEVAKKASLALGRDLSDSMDRLTKGIVKTQPELLDELGIMTRMIPAQQEYARSIGKSIAELTDFEKRQAFATAVLKEGERKFKDINLEANSYSRVLGSMKNVTQDALEGVNKILGPIVSFLAESPVALTGAIALLAGTLLKQAIPALGQFRENARRVQQEGFQRLQVQISEQQQAAIAIDDSVRESAIKRIMTERTTLDKIAAIKKDFNEKTLGKEVRGLLKKSPMDLSQDEMDIIEAKHIQLQEKVNKGTATKNEELQVTKLNQRKEDLKAINQVVRDAAEDEVRLNQLKDERILSHQQLQARKSASLKKAQAKASALSRIADEAAVYGPQIAFQSMGEELKKIEGTFSKVSVAIRGSFSIATSYIGNIFSAYQSVAMVVGLVVAAAGFLNEKLSTSVKEAKAFSEGMDEVQSATENVSRTIDVINKKEISEFLSVESTQARANAIDNLTGSFSSLLSKFDKLEAAKGGWDKFWDSVLFWRDSSEEKLAMSMAMSINSLFEAIEPGKLKDLALVDIQRMFGEDVDPTNLRTLIGSLQKLDDIDIVLKAKEFGKFGEVLNREIGAAAANLTAFKDSLNKLGLAFTDLTNTLIPSDNVSKIGIALGDTANKLQLASKTSADSLKALIELGKDTKALSLIPGGENLGKDLNNLEKLRDSVAKLGKEEAELEKRRGRALSEKLVWDKKSIKSAGIFTELDETKYEEVKVELAKAEDLLSKAKSERIAAESKIESTRQDAEKYARELAASSYRYMARGLAEASAQAGIEVSKGISGILKGLGAITDVFDAEMAKQSIELSLQQIQSAYENTRSLTLLTLAIEKDRASRERKDIEEKMGAYEGAEGVPADLLESLKVIDKQLLILDKATNLATGSQQNLINAKGNVGDPTVMAAMSGYLSALANETFGKMAKEAVLNAQLYTAELNIQLSKFDEIKKTKENTLKLEATSLNIQEKELNNISSRLAILTPSLVKEKERNELNKIDNKLSQEKLDIDTKLAKSQLIQAALQDKLKGTTNERQRTSLFEQLDQAIKLDKEFQAQKKGLEATADIDRSAARLKTINEIFKIKKSELDFQQKLKDISLELLSIEEKRRRIAAQIALETAQQTDAYTPEVMRELQTTASKGSATQAAEDAINSENAKYQKLKSENELEYQKAVANFDTAKQDQLFIQQDLEQTLHDKRLEQIEEEKTLRLKSIDEIAAYKEERENFNATIESLKKIDSVYEGLGTKVADILILSDKKKKSEDQYAKSVARAEDIVASTVEGTEENVKAHKKLENIKKKGVISDLEYEAERAGAFKKFFGEQTAAYKVLDTYEKIKHAQKMYYMAIEIGTDLKNIFLSLTASMAADAKSAASKTPGVFMKFMETMGPLGYAAAALAIAAVLGKGGGAASAPALTAEQRREQGDGQRWTVENGQNKLIDVGGGVWGDAAAKSESIENLLSIMKDTQVEGLFYTSKMVSLLEGIKRGIEGTASLFAGIPGIGSGSTFGTKEGATSKGGFLGISGLFSSTTSTEIIDAGIRFTKSFGDVVNGVADAIKYYETSRTTKTKSGLFGIGGGTKTWESTLETNLNPEIAKSIQDSFQGIGNYLTDLGEKVGMTESVITSSLNQISLTNIFASLKGLSGQALADEWSRVISKILDTGAQTLFGTIVEKYRKLGEGAAETVGRVLDSYEKVDLVFKSIGKSFPDIGEAGFDVSESLVELAGGLEAFLERTNFFRDNFMKGWEKELRLQSSVIEGMARLGYANITTKDQFADLYRSIDITSESGRKLRTSLDEIAPSFISVVDATQELKDSTDDLMMKVYDLIGNREAALALERSRELANTDDRLVALQLYVYALEDLSELESELSRAYNDQISTLESFLSAAEGWIDSLNKLKDSLALGQQSILTPRAKYSEARSQLSQALRAANLTIDFTASKEEQDRQIKEKSDAIGAVQSLASTFLGASQTYNASSSQYITDYNYVQAALASTASTLEAQKFATKTALDYAKAQEALLMGVKQDTRTMTELQAARNLAMQEAEIRRLAWEVTDAAYNTVQISLSEQIIAAVNSGAEEVSLSVINSSIAVIKSIVGEEGANSLANMLREIIGSSSAAQSASDSTLTADQITNIVSASTLTADQITNIVSAVITDALSTYSAAVSVVPTTSDVVASTTSDVIAATEPVTTTSDMVARSFDGGYVDDYRDYISRHQAFADGGYASGWSIVGEQGPELVDFRSPGRVYTAEETFGMFNGTSNSNAEMVKELRALRQEVNALREQQRAETGHLINATYEAQTQNAQAVTQAVTETGKQQVWETKVRQTVKLV